MKAASIAEIKQELKTLPASKLVDICLRLARHKKENKELLTYLLFECGDMELYRASVKKQLEEGFADINTSNVYFIKKSLRKLLRLVNKYIRYSGCRETEVDLLIHFCLQWKESGIPVNRSTALSNLYQAQQKKIFATLALLHDDLQHDYLALVGKMDTKDSETKQEAKVISFLGIRL